MSTAEFGIASVNQVSVMHTMSALLRLTTISKSSILLTRDLVLERKIDGKLVFVLVFMF